MKGLFRGFSAGTEIPSPAPDRFRLAAAGILLLAAALRVPLLTQGLPYISYTDEGGVLHRVMHLVRSGGWDPEWYKYPSLSIYLTTAVLHAMRPIYRLVHGRPLAADIPPEGDLYDLIGPPAVILAGRGVVAAASLVTVLLGMALARRLAGPSAGLAAGLLLALTPALVQRSCIVITDAISAALVAGVLLAAEELRSVLRREGPSSVSVHRQTLFAGGLAGLAAATKYPAAAVFVVILVALFSPGGLSWRRVRLAGLSALAAIFATVVAMPALVFSTRHVMADLVTQTQEYASFPKTRGLFRQALAAEDLGWLLTFAGLLGLVLLGLRRETRPSVIGWLAFGALLLVPLLKYGFQPFRNALPLVPPFVVAASSLFGDESPLARWRGARLLGALVLVLGLAPGIRDAVQMRIVHDSRVQVVDVLASGAWKGKRLLVERELAILPSELERVKAEVTVVPWTSLRELADGGTYDLALVGVFDPAGAPESHAAGYLGWNRWVLSVPADVALGVRPTPVFPNFWRYPDQILRLTPVGTRPDRGVP